jgi:hypothetical protein
MRITVFYNVAPCSLVEILTYNRLYIVPSQKIVLFKIMRVLINRLLNGTRKDDT